MDNFFDALEMLGEENSVDTELLIEKVKSAMLKVDIYILENAIMQMKCTDNIRNFESYLISTLFNEANGRHFKENAEQRWAEYAVKRDMGGF